MRKRSLCLCLSLLLVLGASVGCASAPQEAQDQETSSNAVYIARIAELEAMLQKEREERFISESTYTERIAALEQQISTLVPDTEVSQDPSDETLIFHYRLENGNAIVTGYAGASTLVTVPSTLDGYPVIAIGERAFEGKKIAAVILPQGLEAVGWFAFYGCDGLIDVSIPESVTSIGYAVFDGCPHVSIVCGKESYAAMYAESYGIPCILK